MAGADFLSAVRKLTEQNMSVIELIDAATNLKVAGQGEFVPQLYKMWIDANPADPLLYVVHFNHAVTLSDAGDLAGAKAALESALALNPDFYPAYINLGSTLERMGGAGEAINQWTALANRLSTLTGAALRYKTTALKQIGRVLEAHLQSAAAEAALRQSLDLDPNQLDVVQHFVALRLAQCEWPVVTPWEGVDRKALMRGIGPLSMAAYTDDPMLQLASSWYYNKHYLGFPPVNLQEHRRPSPAARTERRLRIGYVSSDMRQHAVGYLMAEIFDLHDRDRVEVFLYYCGPSTTDSHNARIKASVEHWVDINGLSDEAAARRIDADGIDILVDVNGYTKDARNKVFAMRPAPVIVNWLGYPGSMGSPYHHYIIADDWIIPEELETYYSEKVLRLPCYQPNDRKRVVAPVGQTRAQAGLPEGAFVYCCFNGAQKINRFTFDRWIAILKRVPNSVLWLLEGAEGSNRRLQDYAAQNGVDRARIVFASRMANPEHLARYPLADLFLDTAPYGAHTTASDALWAGVPVLTVSGRGFASRVCGSLTRSAGLPDLVCGTPDEYIERAVALGTDPAAVQAYKDRLAAARDTCVLFDTPLLVRELEGLYDRIWDDVQQGRLPRPDLANLDVYQEVGMEPDHEAVDVMTIQDYEGWYRDMLARHHRFWPIRPDRRLWSAEDADRTDGLLPAAETVPAC